jgi:tRNA/rRNA methyltransferase
MAHSEKDRSRRKRLPVRDGGAVSEGVRVVLVRPKASGNVGSVARAMMNFGVQDLALVSPRRYRPAAAAAMAVHAASVLERHRRFGSLAEAVADCAWVVGTTCRPGSYRRRTRTPREVAPEIAAVAGKGRVALVFGPEDHGLSNEDLKLCHELVTIPTHARYPSLNLAQAVLVCLYEISLARHPAADAPPKLATSAELERMYDHLSRALLAIGFLHGANPEHIMFSIRRTFGRARLDAREVAIWLGVARQIAWYAEGGREIAEEKHRRGQRLK